MPTVISVYDIVKSNDLMTRAAARAVGDEVSRLHAHSVDLDFTSIEALSRSFADEILRVQRDCMKAGITVQFVNTPHDVERMLDMLRHWQRDNSDVVLQPKTVALGGLH